MTKKGTGEFPCTGCGACCRVIWQVLPELAKPDGSCKHLGEDNLCQIYDNRPEICLISFKNHRKRVEQGSTFPEPVFETEEEYFKANAKVCGLLQERYGIDPKYRVVLDNDEQE